jgi:hypothetical protein
MLLKNKQLAGIPEYIAENKQVAGATGNGLGLGADGEGRAPCADLSLLVGLTPKSRWSNCTTPVDGLPAVPDRFLLLY